MVVDIIEKSYPIHFREEEARVLGEHLIHRHNVELIGMRRIGISNFLRFFLYHDDIKQTYLDGGSHLFIPVDLNDLVERELFPFWTLTLKRIADSVTASSAPKNLKSEIEALFLSGIQSQDLFLLTDAIRQAVIKLTIAGFQPTIFFIRFDRIKDAANPAFFDNLQGLRDATNQKLTYVFTSFRRLDVLAPSIFPKAATAGFTQVMYMKPAKEEDLEYIFDTLQRRFTLSLSQEMKDSLFAIVAGNVQYLQLALIILHEKRNEEVAPFSLLEFLEKDERITLQSEELWESLNTEEKEVLLSLLREGRISEVDEERAPYLIKSGFIVKTEGQARIFSQLFADYLSTKGEEITQVSDVHFTKKEHSLMSVLELRKGQICTREEIIESVWPESKVFGVSDWAIDRLVARVRNKLRSQKSPYEIVTIRTRGYKLQDTV